MTETQPDKANPIRATTPDAVRLAKTLIRQARFGALAALDPASGSPMVSRVAVATDFRGAPVILVSQLSAHTKALVADPRCSILLGEPGKGDPLAHPRISVSCKAEFLPRGGGVSRDATARFLRCNPKAKLYAAFADFTFVRLAPVAASLNGGFGQAYALQADDVLSPLYADLSAAEADILDRLNGEDAGLLKRAAETATGKTVNACTAESVDSEGLEITISGKILRLWYDKTVSTQDALFDYLLKFGKTPQK